jgi:hypothetical protein
MMTTQHTHTNEVMGDTRYAWGGSLYASEAAMIRAAWGHWVTAGKPATGEEPAPSRALVGEMLAAGWLDADAAAVCRALGVQVED